MNSGMGTDIAEGTMDTDWDDLFPRFLRSSEPQQITRDIRLFFPSHTHKFTDKYNIQCFCYPMIQADYFYQTLV